MPVPQIKITYHPFDPSASIQSDCVVDFRSTVPEKASFSLCPLKGTRACRLGEKNQGMSCLLSFLFLSHEPPNRDARRGIV